MGDEYQRPPIKIKTAQDGYGEVTLGVVSWARNSTTIHRQYLPLLWPNRLRPVTQR